MNRPAWMRGITSQLSVILIGGTGAFASPAPASLQGTVTVKGGTAPIAGAAPNPETGIALKDDPALAMIEMVNEDSLFFWTFNPDAGQSGNIPDAQRALVDKQFGDWLLAKYPGQTLAQIRSSVWGGLSTPQDAFADGRVGFRPLWNIANERTKRDCDTGRFLAALQTAFYRQTYDYLKQTLRHRGLVYASNWQTASPQYLGPLDKWSNAVADFMDRHGYFGSYHTGDAASWSIQSGQVYDDRAAVTFQKDQGAGEDFNNPVFDLIYNGQPPTITEVNWTPPNRFRADFPLLAAAYTDFRSIAVDTQDDLALEEARLSTLEEAGR